jgi:dihydrofolate reductase
MSGTWKSPPGSVVVSMFVTMDGYIVGPEEDMSWAIEGFDPEMQDDIAVSMSTEFDGFLFGRVTYEIFAAYWPNAVPYAPGDALDPAGGKEDPRIIGALDELPKIVFSKTMKSAPWQNTRIVSGGIEDEIRRNKRGAKRPFNVQGSASVVRALEQAGLVDEYRLFLHPVLLGSGKQLFGPGARHDFTLVRTKQYASGVLATTHARKR